MININEYFKGIGLRTIFRNILQKNYKLINSFIVFYIFRENGVKNFLNMIY